MLEAIGDVLCVIDLGGRLVLRWLRGMGGGGARGVGTALLNVHNI